MTAPLTKDQTSALFFQLADGVEKTWAKVPLLEFDGHSYAPADLVAKLRHYGQLRLDVDHAKAAYETALDRADLAAGESHALMMSLCDYVRAALGNSPTALEPFGLTARKPRKKISTEAAVAAVAKRAATRTARGTKGPRAKLAIHGDVTGVEITPVDAPAPAAPATPAIHK